MIGRRVFTGPSTVAVTRLGAERAMRLVVSNAGEGAGVHPVAAGLAFDTDGDAWVLDVEWELYGTGQGWGLSYVDVDATYDVDDGLVVTLRAHNGNPTAGTVGHVDAVITVTSRDPDLAPPHPGARPPDFTLPEA